LSIAQSTLPSFIDEPTQAVQAGLAIGLEPASHRPRNNSQETSHFLLRTSVIQTQQSGQTAKDSLVGLLIATFLDLLPLRTTQAEHFLVLGHRARLILVTLVNLLIDERKNAIIIVVVQDQVISNQRRHILTNVEQAS
jgi:hypothetical protein